MAEAITVDFTQFQDCETLYDAAYLWAEQNDIPTWNGWTSLIAQLRRRYPNDPAHSGL